MYRSTMCGHVAKCATISYGIGLVVGWHNQGVRCSLLYFSVFRPMDNRHRKSDYLAVLNCWKHPLLRYSTTQLACCVRTEIHLHLPPCQSPKPITSTRPQSSPWATPSMRAPHDQVLCGTFEDVESLKHTDTVHC